MAKLKEILEAEAQRATLEQKSPLESMQFLADIKKSIAEII